MSSPETGADGKSGREPAAAAVSAPVASLWVLDRADHLLEEVALALWLSVASAWRIPRAAVARDSMGRLEGLVAARRALPPRLNLLVASVASALLLAWLLPTRTPHMSAGTLFDRLATASAESWLLVAAPALISLWLTVIRARRTAALGRGPGLWRADDRADAVHFGDDDPQLRGNPDIG